MGSDQAIVREKAVRKKAAGKPTAKPTAHPDIDRAMAELAASGTLAGTRSVKISARVDPGLLDAAAKRLGLRKGDVSEIVNASLAVVAAPDRFKRWLHEPGVPLPDDFELAI